MLILFRAEQVQFEAVIPELFGLKIALVSLVTGDLGLSRTATHRQHERQ